MIERNSSALARELRRVKHALFTFYLVLMVLFMGRVDQRLYHCSLAAAKPEISRKPLDTTILVYRTTFLA